MRPAPSAPYIGALCRGFASSRQQPCSAQLLGQELPPRLDTRLLFPGPAGGPYKLINFRAREFTWAREAAGLPESVTPYTPRHSGIPWVLAAGIPPSDVARFAGTSVTMLERTYAHLLESSAEAARQRLDVFAAADRQKAEERLGH